MTSEHLKKRDDESQDDYLIRLYSNKDEYDIDSFIIADLMNKATGKNHGESKWRKDYAQYVYWTNYYESKKGSISPADVKYKESHEVKPDGTQISDKLIVMSEEDKKNPDFLLKAHGYDPKEWTLTSSRNNIWNTYSKQDGIMTLYSSKIAVKPKESEFNIDRLIEKLKNIEPIKINRKNISTDIPDGGLLEIPLFDQHFGISDYEYYKNTQKRLLSAIYERFWDEIVIVIGQDMFHNDGFTSQTTKGTVIEPVDMEKAWEDATRFYVPIIEDAMSYSEEVKIVYSPGNHDEAMGWAFTKYLKALFPECNFDDKLEEHKLHVYGDNAIGITHGDRGGQRARKEMHNVFSALFPVEWGLAKNREVHMGHFHQEDARDVFGTMIRTLATSNKTDEWHKRNGYVGAHKRFMIFKYSKENLESIHYV